VRIRYEGLGNAKLIELPNISWPEGIEVYDTKSDGKFFKDGSSFKEFEVLVIAHKEGTIKLPSLQLTFFDPSLKKYVSESTQELVLNITAGTGLVVNPDSSSTITSPKDIKPQIQLEFPEASIFNFSANRPWVYFLVGLIGVITIVFQSLYQLRAVSAKPELNRIVLEKMKIIEGALGKGDHRKVGSEATNLIYLLVAQLAGQKRADQELHLLVNEISAKDRQFFIPRITEIFDYFQLIGFSPDEIMKQTLSRKPVSEQWEGLKKLTNEILVKLKKENG
jgi:hypothetical protein